MISKASKRLMRSSFEVIPNNVPAVRFVFFVMAFQDFGSAKAMSFNN
jgi:hypothetical protein